MTLEEKIDLLFKKINVIEEDVKGIQIQIDLIADRVYDYTNEYEIEL
jgi:hypothetical protein